MLCNISQNAMGQTPGGGGYPYPIMLCNISQNAMGQPLGGVPCQVQLGGRVPCPGGYRGGGYHGGGYPGGGYPGRGYSGRGVPRSGTPLAGYSPSQVRMGGVPS